MTRGSTAVTFVQGSSVRLSLLRRLASKPHTPTELAAIENKHVSHVSRALVELESHGLVLATDSGSREHYYRITSQGYAIAIAIATRTMR